MDTSVDRARGGPTSSKTRLVLTDAKLRDLAPRERTYKVSDGGNGLYVVISPSGSRSFRYDCPNTLRRTSNGLIPKTDPQKVTTILGRYDLDMNAIKSQLKPKESLAFGDVKAGEFNMLNAPAWVWERVGKEHWFEKVNKSFLDKAIERGDNILIATLINAKTQWFLNKATGKMELTTFGKEIHYLAKKGYRYDKNLKAMVLD